MMSNDHLRWLWCTWFPLVTKLIFKFELRRRHHQLIVCSFSLWTKRVSVIHTKNNGLAHTRSKLHKLKSCFVSWWWVPLGQSIQCCPVCSVHICRVCSSIMNCTAVFFDRDWSSPALELEEWEESSSSVLVLFFFLPWTYFYSCQVHSVITQSSNQVTFFVALFKFTPFFPLQSTNSIWNGFFNFAFDFWWAANSFTASEDSVLRCSALLKTLGNSFWGWVLNL